MLRRRYKGSLRNGNFAMWPETVPAARPLLFRLACTIGRQPPARSLSFLTRRGLCQATCRLLHLDPPFSAVPSFSPCSPARLPQQPRRTIIRRKFLERERRSCKRPIIDSTRKSNIYNSTCFTSNNALSAQHSGVIDSYTI